MTQLESLREMSASLGFVRDIREEAAGFDCPVHGTPVIEQHLEAFGGWQGLQVCPAFDGTCSYDPDGRPEAIEPPEETDADATKAGPHTKAGSPAKPGSF